MNDFRTVLPKSATDWEGMVKLFAEKSKMLTTRFYPVASKEEAFKTIKEIAAQEDWKSIGSHHSELNDSAVQATGLPCLWTDSGYDKTELEKVDAGITGCDALIAQTGSAFVSTKSAGGRALSILPPHHVIIATKEQLLSDLPAAYAYMQKKYEGSFPSMMTLISGPSRTGDIERILVLGAHGPKKLSIILIG